jgi:hypothetical protein
LQQALGESGIGQGDEGIELRFELILLVFPSRYHDAAGADVEPNMLGAGLFAIVHESIS